MNKVIENDINHVTFNGVSYEINPLGFRQGLRVSSLLTKYVSKGSGIIQVFMDKSSGVIESNSEMTKKALVAFQDIADDEFNDDLLLFVHLISNIPQNILADTNVIEVLDQLPIIVEKSRVADMIKKVWEMLNSSTEGNNSTN